MNRLQRLAPDTLRLERHLDAPPEVVWKRLADPELRQQWFAGGAVQDFWALHRQSTAEVKAQLGG